MHARLERTITHFFGRTITCQKVGYICMWPNLWSGSVNFRFPNFHAHKYCWLELLTIVVNTEKKSYFNECGFFSMPTQGIEVVTINEKKKTPKEKKLVFCENIQPSWGVISLIRVKVRNSSSNLSQNRHYYNKEQEDPFFSYFTQFNIVVHDIFFYYLFFFLFTLFQFRTWRCRLKISIPFLHNGLGARQATLLGWTLQGRESTNRSLYLHFFTPFLFLHLIRDLFF